MRHSSQVRFEVVLERKFKEFAETNLAMLVPFASALVLHHIRQYFYSTEQQLKDWVMLSWSLTTLVEDTVGPRGRKESTQEQHIHSTCSTPFPYAGVGIIDIGIKWTVRRKAIILSEFWKTSKQKPSRLPVPAVCISSHLASNPMAAATCTY